MNKRTVIKIVITALKALVGLAAAANLIALFVFHYTMPSWLQRRRPAEEMSAAINTPAAETEIETGEYLEIPVVPVNYSGEADMDGMVLSGVYLMGGDGQPIEDVDITYEILPGETAQKKTVLYSVELDSGAVLTKERAMNLTTRYTGPTITLLGILPGIDPAESQEYAALIGETGIIRADDGFGNDITEQVVADFDGLSDESPEAEMTLSLENQIHDTFEMTLNVEVKDYTGVVVVLTRYRMTLEYGGEFSPYDYIAYAHDTEGNDLTEEVTADSDLDVNTPGEYRVLYWVSDSEGTYSPTKTMYVTVEEPPEEEAEAEEAP